MNEKIETLARKMARAVHPLSWELLFNSTRERMMSCARVAYEELGKADVMSEERHTEIIHGLMEVVVGASDDSRMKTSIAIAEKLKLIPPRPAPSLGERFAATIDLSDEAKKLGEIAKKFDAAVASLSNSALAELERRMGGGK